MDLFFQRIEGIPDGSRMSVRWGNLVKTRQLPAEQGRPVRFPVEAITAVEDDSAKLDIDVLMLLGKTKLRLSTGTDKYMLQFQSTRKDCNMSCGVEVRIGEEPAEPSSVSKCVDVFPHSCEGIPEGSMLSARLGSNSKVRPLPMETGKPLRLQYGSLEGNAEIDIEIWAVCAKSKLLMQPGTDRYRVEFSAKMSCDLEIQRRGEQTTTPANLPACDRVETTESHVGSVASRHSHAIAAQKYMNDHKLVEAMHMALQASVISRSEKPLLDMAQSLIQFSQGSKPMDMSAGDTAKNASNESCNDTAQKHGSEQSGSRLDMEKWMEHVKQNEPTYTAGGKLTGPWLEFLQACVYFEHRVPNWRLLPQFSDKVSPVFMVMEHLSNCGFAKHWLALVRAEKECQEVQRAQTNGNGPVLLPPLEQFVKARSGGSTHRNSVASTVVCPEDEVEEDGKLKNVAHESLQLAVGRAMTYEETEYCASASVLHEEPSTFNSARERRARAAELRAISGSSPVQEAVIPPPAKPKPIPPEDTKFESEREQRARAAELRSTSGDAADQPANPPPVAQSMLPRSTSPTNAADRERHAHAAELRCSPPPSPMAAPNELFRSSSAPPASPMPAPNELLVRPGGADMARSRPSSPTTAAQRELNRLAAEKRCKPTSSPVRPTNCTKDAVDEKELPRTGSPRMDERTQVSVEWLTRYLARSASDTQYVVEMAVQNHEKVGIGKLINMFEVCKCDEGLVLFLREVLPECPDKDLTIKLIQTCCQGALLEDLRQLVRESTCHDPHAVIQVLKRTELPIPGPLSILCDYHGFHEDLVQYLHTDRKCQQIEDYVKQADPLVCPKVIGHLLDVEAPAFLLQRLLKLIPTSCPAELLIDEMETRGKLNWAQDWLEALYDNGAEQPAIHNALAKIYVDIDRRPDEFFKSNAFYDPLVVGKYCEDKKQPQLAFMAYAHARGSCDKQLLQVSNEYGLFRSQAHYLMERQDLDLWSSALSQESEHRCSLVPEVIRRASLTSTFANTSSEIISTARALAQADLQEDLIELVLARNQMAGSSEVQAFAGLMDASAARTTADRLFEQKSFDGANAFYTILKCNSRLDACKIAGKAVPNGVEKAPPNRRISSASIATTDQDFIEDDDFASSLAIQHMSKSALCRALPDHSCATGSEEWRDLQEIHQHLQSRLPVHLQDGRQEESQQRAFLSS